MSEILPARSPAAGPVAPSRVVTCAPDGNLRLTRLDVAAPGAGEVRVRIVACGVCPAESAAWSARRASGLRFGHEPAAVIEHLGEGVAGRHVGDRVFVHHRVGCGTCRLCLTGREVHCPAWQVDALSPGAMADHALVAAGAVEAGIVSLPSGVDDSVATLIEPLGCALRAWTRAAGDLADRRVVILGLGVWGILHVMIARRRGARQIIAVDPVPDRLRQARTFGADEVINVETEDVAARLRMLTEGEGADLSVVMPGSDAVMELAAESAAVGGTVVLFSPLPASRRWAIPVADLFRREVNLVTSRSAGSADIAQAIEMIAAGPAPEWRRLITHRFP